MMTSCQSEFASDDYTAYFGGEIDNPSLPYVLFYKDGVIRDTLYLDQNNRFFKAFDSLTPGIYSFRQDPEFQYVYFDKNDSLLVSVNLRDFDESLVYSGRGDLKNNYLTEVYLQNEKERNDVFSLLTYDLDKFIATTDSLHNSNLALYHKRKEVIKWSKGFDKFIRATIDLPYYGKREFYPQLHLMHTGNDVYEQLPKDFYDFRSKVDFNDQELSQYAPYISYMSTMLNNMSAITYHNHFTNSEVVLKTNLNKLHIADSIIRDQNVKNSILGNIAHTYFLEDQHIPNNKEFLKTYLNYSTDQAKNQEIVQLSEIIKSLVPGNRLPEITLEDLQGNYVPIDNIFEGKPTVVVFWISKFQSHFTEAYKRVQDYEKRYPWVQFVAINLDESTAAWKMELDRIHIGKTKQYRAKDLGELNKKIGLTRIHRTLVMRADGSISNAFSSLFEINIHKEIEKIKPVTP